MNIINMTGKSVTFITKAGVIYYTSPSEADIKLHSYTENVEFIKIPDLDDGMVTIPITEQIPRKVMILPRWMYNQIYIVRDEICRAFPERDDFYVVAEVKGETEENIMCRSLSKSPYGE